MSKYSKLKFELTVTLVQEAFLRLMDVPFGIDSKGEYEARHEEWQELMELLDELE